MSPENQIEQTEIEYDEIDNVIEGLKENGFISRGQYAGPWTRGARIPRAEIFSHPDGRSIVIFQGKQMDHTGRSSHSSHFRSDFGNETELSGFLTKWQINLPQPL